MSDNDNTGNTEASDRPRPQRSLNFGALKEHVMVHKIDVSLWTIRMLTIAFTIGYFLPLFWSSHNAYYKVLLANAATSALRLHQRLGRVEFTREFLAQLLLEDSCHNLFYSLIFINLTPITLVLLPVALFAVLHASSYSLTLLDVLGQNSWWGARLLISLVEFQSMNILRLIAFTEIVLMPFTLLLMLMGRAGIYIPFVYYHFLMKRYTSRRNPYTRNMFHELRLLFEHTAANQKLPGFVRSGLLGMVNFVMKLAPLQQAPHSE